MTQHLSRLAALAALLSLAVVGCAKKQAALPPPLPPMIDVESPVVRYVTEYEYFTGRTEASESVELRSRVSGYLKSGPISRTEAKNGEVKEGDDVKRGRLLFEIEPSTFAAEAERAATTVNQYEAMVEKLGRDYERARSLSSTRGAMTREEMDKIIGDRKQAQANLEGAKASLKLARINLAYTSIPTPIDGRISRRYVDPGNLVKADDTILTTIVRLDPIHAYFDVDERTVIRFRNLLATKQITSARDTPLKVMLALADENKYTREGQIDFIDNRLEPGTGTLRIRAELPNKQQFMSPGMFIRIRLPVGKEKRALLVPETALASKQGQKVIYVVRNEPAKTEKGEPILDDEGNSKMTDRVYEIPVEPGQLETDNWRVIKTSGRRNQWAKDADPADVLREQVLKTGDRVVVSGLQRVRDKGEVRIAKKAEKK